MRVGRRHSLIGPAFERSSPIASYTYLNWLAVKSIALRRSKLLISGIIVGSRIVIPTGVCERIRAVLYYSLSAYDGRNIFIRQNARTSRALLVSPPPHVHRGVVSLPLLSATPAVPRRPPPHRRWLPPTEINCTLCIIKLVLLRMICALCAPSFTDVPSSRNVMKVTVLLQPSQSALLALRF